MYSAVRCVISALSLEMSIATALLYYNVLKVQQAEKINIQSKTFTLIVMLPVTAGHDHVWRGKKKPVFYQYSVLLTLLSPIIVINL